MNRILLSIVLVLGVVGCKSKAELLEIQKGMPKKTQVRHVDGFNAMLVEGPFDVDLHTGYHHPRLILTGPRGGLPLISTAVKNRTLVIKCHQNCVKYGRYKIRIEAHRLTAFTYRGAGRITGHAIHAAQLDLNINN